MRAVGGGPEKGSGDWSVRTFDEALTCRAERITNYKARPMGIELIPLKYYGAGRANALMIEILRNVNCTTLK